MQLNFLGSVEEGLPMYASQPLHTKDDFLSLFQGLERTPVSNVCRFLDRTETETETQKKSRGCEELHEKRWESRKSRQGRVSRRKVICLIALGKQNPLVYFTLMLSSTGCAPAVKKKKKTCTQYYGHTTIKTEYL